MADTVKVPGVGPVKKKTAIAVGVGVGVVGLIFVIRQRKASSSPAATGTPGAATGQQTDPAGNVGTIDPATGYVYGSAEDTQALAAAQGAGGAYNTSGLGAGGLGGYYYGPGGSTQTTPPGPGNFADNAEWAQYAENYMITTLQADPNTVGNALGKYITGQPVDASQQNLIEEAIAVAGYPPQAGPGGHPPNINRGSSKPPPGQTVPVPHITGQPAGEAFNVLRAAQLTPHEDSAGIRPDWIVTSQSPAAGTKVSVGSKVSYQAKAASGHPPPGQKVKVPNVVGRTAGDAYNILEVRGGFEMADPKAGQRGEPRRKVRSQSPRAGTEVSKGSRVTINT